MDWSDFFEKTRVAAKADSFYKLAPMLGITDGAIAHYRQGRRVPQVWVVAEALKLQGHPEPEKAAIAIMKAGALTSEERGFWRRLAAATAMILLCAIPLASFPTKASTYATELLQSAHYVLRGWLARLNSRSRHTVWNRPGAAATLAA